MCYTEKYLIKRLNTNPYYAGEDMSSERLARFLCGENYRLAQDPFHRLFLENVAFCSDGAIAAILLIQLRHTNGERLFGE